MLNQESKARCRFDQISSRFRRSLTREARTSRARCCIPRRPAGSFGTPRACRCKSRKRFERLPRHRARSSGCLRNACPACRRTPPESTEYRPPFPRKSAAIHSRTRNTRHTTCRDWAQASQPKPPAAPLTARASLPWPSPRSCRWICSSASSARCRRGR
jgi:hypothetical protein